VHIVINHRSAVLVAVGLIIHIVVNITTRELTVFTPDTHRYDATGGAK